MAAGTTVKKVVESPISAAIAGTRGPATCNAAVLWRRHARLKPSAANPSVVGSVRVPSRCSTWRRSGAASPFPSVGLTTVAGSAANGELLRSRLRSGSVAGGAGLRLAVMSWMPKADRITQLGTDEASVVRLPAPLRPRGLLPVLAVPRSVLPDVRLLRAPTFSCRRCWRRSGLPLAAELAARAAALQQDRGEDQPVQDAHELPNQLPGVRL